MAQIDSSIYFQNNNSFGDGISSGMKLGQAFKEGQQKDLELKKKKSIDEAISGSFKQNPDGSFTMDRGAAVGKLSQLGYGSDAFDLDNKLQKQAAEQQEQNYKKQTQYFDFIGRAASGVKDTPSLQYFKEEGKKLGYDVSQIGDEYNDDVKNRINQYANMAFTAQQQYGKERDAQDFELRKEELTSRGLDRKDAREERRMLFNVSRNDRQDAIKEKKEEKELTLAVPGFERTGEVLPKPEEAQKFRKATAASQQLSSKLNRLKELVAKYGAYEKGGEGGTEMDSLATEIQLIGKSPELYELGVLAGPDLTLLNKITADPSSWDSMFTRDGSRQKQIDTQLKSIQQKLDSTAGSLGYKKQQKPNAQQEKPNKIIQNGFEYTLNPSTGQYE